MGPRQVMAWSGSERKNSIEMARTPPWASRGMILRSPDTMGRPCTPSIRGIEYPHTSASMAAAVLPSAWRAAARLAVTVDLPTPPLPEPTQITFLTAASAPCGRPPWRPRRCWSVCFSSAESTSKPTRTWRTPSSSLTFVTTACSKWERMGQPGVVRDTITSTAPSSGCSIERTIPSETMSLRSSGSMTLLRASVICSVVGITFIEAEAVSGHVRPLHAFFDGQPVTIRSDVPPRSPVDVVQAGSGTSIRRLRVQPGRAGTTWDGLTTRGRAAPDGRYVFRAGATRLGSVVFHGHYFPVRGPHWERGAIGRFGAPRSGGRTHEGFDVVAACGTPLAAARGGRVVKNVYDPVLYGNLLIVRNRATRRDYWYAHLAQRSRLHRGTRVRTGERIGRVGATGNARTVGCHLHFEIHSRGRATDPAPELHAWDRWS